MPLLQKAYLGSTALFAEKPWFYDSGASIAGSNTSAAGVTITASSTTHTKGSWSEIIASTSTDATLITFEVSAVASTNVDTAMLIDIGVGASGSETVIIPDIAVGGAIAVGTGVGLCYFQCPVNIPSGSRISARCQATIASDTVVIRKTVLYKIGDAALLPTSVDSFGANTATSQGLAMSGSSGTWVQVTASTSDDYIAFAMFPSMVGNTMSAGKTITFDIGVGASGSEVAFGSIVATFGTTETVLTDAPIMFFGKEVTSGSRIAVRHNIAANPTQIGITVVAVPKV